MHRYITKKTTVNFCFLNSFKQTGLLHKCFFVACKQEQNIALSWLNPVIGGLVCSNIHFTFFWLTPHQLILITFFIWLSLHSQRTSHSLTQSDVAEITYKPDVSSIYSLFSSDAIFKLRNKKIKKRIGSGGVHGVITFYTKGVCKWYDKISSSSRIG